jgi:hypothetical protein
MLPTTRRRRNSWAEEDAFVIGSPDRSKTRWSRWSCQTYLFRLRFWFNRTFGRSLSPLHQSQAAGGSGTGNGVTSCSRGSTRERCQSIFSSIITVIVGLFMLLMCIVVLSFLLRMTIWRLPWFKSDQYSYLPPAAPSSVSCLLLLPVFHSIKEINICLNG